MLVVREGHHVQQEQQHQGHGDGAAQAYLSHGMATGTGGHQDFSFSPLAEGVLKAGQQVRP